MKTIAYVAFLAWITYLMVSAIEFHHPVVVRQYTRVCPCGMVESGYAEVKVFSNGDTDWGRCECGARP